MPQNLSQVRVIDPILTHHANGYKHPKAVGDTLFPRVPVNISGGQILEFGVEDFKLVNARRAPGGDTKDVEYGHLGRPYALVQDALNGKVPREHLRDAAVTPGINLGTRATNRTLDTLLLGLESEQSQIALNAANYAATHKVTLAGGTKWNTATGDPSGNIEAARDVVRQSIGMRPNVAVISPAALTAARNNPNILDRFKYTSASSITADMLARLWELDRVVVGDAVFYNETTSQMQDVWGTDVVVAYVPQTDLDMGTPSYGWTYTLDGHPLVEQAFYETSKKSWLYPVTYERIPVLTGMSAGYLIQAAG